MGINGLLPKLASIVTQVHLQELANLTVAVDAYVWLHRGAYACSSELCQDIPTSKYISYCMNQIELLRSHNITPILVFDGCYLPAKGGTETERRGKRELSKKQAAEHLLNGNHGAAHSCFKKAVDITPRMAYNLIKVLRAENVQYIVAPYEADAQMAFLALNNFVDAVITEDSDLIVYGCPRIIFKLDKTGCGQQILLSQLGNNSEKDLDLRNFTRENFRHMCIISGCDYLDGLPGLGLKTAHQFVSKHKEVPSVLRQITIQKNIVLPSSYEEDFKRADLTFLHQRVWDPEGRKLVTLHPLPSHIEESGMDLSFIGPEIDDELARKIAEGEYDPITKQPFESSNSKESALVSRDANLFLSMRLRSSGSFGSSTNTTPSLQKNHILNYFTASPKPSIQNAGASMPKTPTSANVRMRSSTDHNQTTPSTPSFRMRSSTEKPQMTTPSTPSFKATTPVTPSTPGVVLAPDTPPSKSTPSNSKVVLTSRFFSSSSVEKSAVSSSLLKRNSSGSFGSLKKIQAVRDLTGQLSKINRDDGEELLGVTHEVPDSPVKLKRSLSQKENIELNQRQTGPDLLEVPNKQKGLGSGLNMGYDSPSPLVRPGRLTLRSSLFTNSSDLDISGEGRTCGDGIEDTKVHEADDFDSIYDNKEEVAVVTSPIPVNTLEKDSDSEVSEDFEKVESNLSLFKFFSKKKTQSDPKTSTSTYEKTVIPDSPQDFYENDDTLEVYDNLVGDNNRKRKREETEVVYDDDQPSHVLDSPLRKAVFSDSDCEIDCGLSGKKQKTISSSKDNFYANFMVPDSPSCPDYRSESDREEWIGGGGDKGGKTTSLAPNFGREEWEIAGDVTTLKTPEEWQPRTQKLFSRSSTTTTTRGVVLDSKSEGEKGQEGGLLGSAFFSTSSTTTTTGVTMLSKSDSFGSAKPALGRSGSSFSKLFSFRPSYIPGSPSRGDSPRRK
eukprot:TRINITY_DN7324_c0_g1_i1.p1 TRINITY_DN7324_c0_g1~~TRINITY_DN7324_c0_g1_i1.p1  ORF type:complete len:950 (-),score=166.50 TRINITY_DN7324_c0_g1_i1:62-2911(-)